MDLRGPEGKGGNEALDGVACDSKQVSVHEMWKRQQVSEDAWEMCRNKVVDEGHKTKVQKMAKVAHGRTRHGKKSGWRGRSFDLMQDICWLRQTMGPQGVNEKMGTKEYGKMLRRILTLEEGRVPAKDARGWKI